MPTTGCGKTFSVSFLGAVTDLYKRTSCIREKTKAKSNLQPYGLLLCVHFAKKIMAVAMEEVIDELGP